MSTYWEIEADLPGLAEVRPPFSIEWYERYRELHLAKHPDSDRGTRYNLDMFVDMAEAQLRAVTHTGYRAESVTITGSR